jgi:hypothetical protein
MAFAIEVRIKREALGQVTEGGLSMDIQNSPLSGIEKSLPLLMLSSLQPRALG